MPSSMGIRFIIEVAGDLTEPFPRLSGGLPLVFAIRDVGCAYLAAFSGLWSSRHIIPDTLLTVDDMNRIP